VFLESFRSSRGHRSARFRPAEIGAGVRQPSLPGTRWRQLLRMTPTLTQAVGFPPANWHYRIEAERIAQEEARCQPVAEILPT